MLSALVDVYVTRNVAVNLLLPYMIFPAHELIDFVCLFDRVHTYKYRVHLLDEKKKNVK